jgi:hypothetical protein
MKSAILRFDLIERMSELNLEPKPLLLKIWNIITWRWRLQIAINVPFAILWFADKSNPAVHQFDIALLTAIHAEWMAPMIGIG